MNLGTNAHQVVIIGGGFAGLYTAQNLTDPACRVTLVDRRNFHLFQPLLYQVATGALSPANIASPLRSILHRQKNVRVWLGEARDVDLNQRELVLSDGRLPFDTLVVATGSTHNYFGHDDWAARAPGLKTIEDSTEIRRRILLAFEAAERESDPARRKAWLTFVIVGAGPTGVELAGALSEISRVTLRGDFRDIDPATARILLVDAVNRVLPSYPSDLSAKAAKTLARLGVEVRTGAHVNAVTDESVTLTLNGLSEQIPTRTVLWAAGIVASPLARRLGELTGSPLDRAGRIEVQPDLTLAGHPEVLVIGDMAHCRSPNGQPLPAVAPVAMQQGAYAARLIRARRRGKTIPPFRYRHYGSMATIGRSAAVAEFGWLRFNGLLAWLAWLFVHLMKLVTFENRVFVLAQWAWNYTTRNRTARLITGENPLPFSRHDSRRG